MGNNKYQSRLQSLEVLDQYISKLKIESETMLGYPMALKNLHESFADTDEWNDVKHTEFFEGPINDIILTASDLRVKIEAATEQLLRLKSMYSNAGVK
jgi:hypothetical protein